MSKNKETIADIVAEMRDEGHIGDASCLEWVGAKILHYADRIGAAAKREVESIHRAMVLIAGIEMENSENPPRLWTALEDAYDALSDALGTDGDTTSDEEEAKAIGRHFVVKPYGNAANMRKALEQISSMGEQIDYQLGSSEETVYAFRNERCLAHNISECARAALSEPPRNCDVGTAEEQFDRHETFCKKYFRYSMANPCAKCPNYKDGDPSSPCVFRFLHMPYGEGGAR